MINSPLVTASLRISAAARTKAKFGDIEVAKNVIDGIFELSVVTIFKLTSLLTLFVESVPRFTSKTVPQSRLGINMEHMCKV